MLTGKFYPFEYTRFFIIAASVFAFANIALTILMHGPAAAQSPRPYTQVAELELSKSWPDMMISALTKAFKPNQTDATYDESTLALPPATRLIMKNEVPIPNGYYELCVTSPAVCKPAESHHSGVNSRGELVLTKPVIRKFRRINASINHLIRPVHSQTWSAAGLDGDCKLYALKKRQELIAEGVPASDALIAIVQTASQEQHAVLVVRTNSGDYVFDNLNQQILPWNWTSYKFEKVQSPRDTWVWLAL